jgi:hypothetical protein
MQYTQNGKSGFSKLAFLGAPGNVRLVMNAGKAFLLSVVLFVLVMPFVIGRYLYVTMHTEYSVTPMEKWWMRMVEPLLR